MRISAAQKNVKILYVLAAAAIESTSISERSFALEVGSLGAPDVKAEKCLGVSTRAPWVVAFRAGKTCVTNGGCESRFSVRYSFPSYGESLLQRPVDHRIRVAQPERQAMERRCGNYLEG